jgi:hypothetical protein
MSYTALSLSQTPPLAVPLRYFLSAPLYLIAAGLILVSNGPELFASRWSPAMLALTHLITLGFLGSCMLGAIQQLLPVLLGVPVAGAGPVSLLLYLLWSLGTAALVLGMGLGWAAGLQGGAMLLGLAAAGIALVGGRALWRTTSRHATVPAMALALLALLVAFSIALYLLWRFGWQLPLAHPLTRLHIGWGAVGWVGLLIIGVAYQVVPMFQITPEYPRWLRRALVPALAALLLLWSLLPWPVAEPLLSGLIAAAWPTSPSISGAWRWRHCSSPCSPGWRTASIRWWPWSWRRGCCSWPVSPSRRSTACSTRSSPSSSGCT